MVPISSNLTKVHRSKNIDQTTCLFKKLPQSLMVFKTHLPIATCNNKPHLQRVISKLRFISSLDQDWVTCLRIMQPTSLAPKTLAKSQINKEVKTQVSAQESQAEVVLIEFPNLQLSTVPQETWTRWWDNKALKIRNLSMEMEIHKLIMGHLIILNSSKLKFKVRWINLMERDNRFKCIKIYKLQW